MHLFSGQSSQISENSPPIIHEFHLVAKGSFDVIAAGSTTPSHPLLPLRIWAEQNFLLNENGGGRGGYYFSKTPVVCTLKKEGK